MHVANVVADLDSLPKRPAGGRVESRPRPIRDRAADHISGFAFA